VAVYHHETVVDTEVVTSPFIAAPAVDAMTVRAYANPFNTRTSIDLTLLRTARWR